MSIKFWMPSCGLYHINKPVGDTCYRCGASAFAPDSPGGSRTPEQVGLLPPPPDCLRHEQAKPRCHPAACLRRKTVFPSGITAANLLGFTTQNPKRGEIATSASSLPRKLVGGDTVIHTRRPGAWANLSQTDAALLDFLRRGGKTSELAPAETVRRTLSLLSEKGRFERLLNVADSEPPRVRAMLGALGEQLGKTAPVLRRLRISLNPFSRFDFGLMAELPHARNWQAKERRSHEIV